MTAFESLGMPSSHLDPLRLAWIHSRFEVWPSFKTLKWLLQQLQVRPSGKVSCKDQGKPCLVVPLQYPAGVIRGYKGVFPDGKTFEIHLQAWKTCSRAVIWAGNGGSEAILCQGWREALTWPGEQLLRKGHLDKAILVA